MCKAGWVFDDTRIQSGGAGINYRIAVIIWNYILCQLIKSTGMVADHSAPK